jgi:hypothetical protein
MGSKFWFWGKIRSCTDCTVENTIARRAGTGLLSGAGRDRVRPTLESGYQFEVQQAGGKAVWQGIGGIGKVLDQHIGDGIIPVN